MKTKIKKSSKENQLNPQQRKCAVTALRTLGLPGFPDTPHVRPSASTVLQVGIISPKLQMSKQIKTSYFCPRSQGLRVEGNGSESRKFWRLRLSYSLTHPWILFTHIHMLQTWHLYKQVYRCVPGHLLSIVYSIQESEVSERKSVC